MTGISELMAEMDYGKALQSAEAGRAWIAAQRLSGPGDFALRNPATGELLSVLQPARLAEVTAATEAASAALPLWAALPAEERARLLEELATRIRGCSALAEVESLSTGRPLRHLRDAGLPRAAACFSRAARRVLTAAEEAPGLTVVFPDEEAPLLSACHLVAPLLARGEAVLISPPAVSPLSAVLLAELAQQAGLPPGLLGALPGDSETTALLLPLPAVTGVTFAGPDARARDIAVAAAGRGRRIRLLLRRPSAILVPEDADQEAAAEAVAEAVIARQGVSGLRLLVQEGIAPQFTERLALRLSRLRRGDPLDLSTDLAAGAETLAAWLAGVTTFRSAAESLQLMAEEGAPGQLSLWSEGASPATALALRAEAAEVRINTALRLPGDHAGFHQTGLRPLAALPPAAAAVPGSDPAASLAALRKALAMAAAARDWAALSPEARGRHLWSLAGGLQSRGADAATEAAQMQSALLRAAAATGVAEGDLHQAEDGLLELCRREPWGVLGLVCPPDASVADLLILAGPALASGNRLVCVLAEGHAADAQWLTERMALSDLPRGVLSLIPGPAGPLARALAADPAIAALWYCGAAEDCAGVEAACAQNLKPLFIGSGPASGAPTGRKRRIGLSFGV